MFVFCSFMLFLDCTLVSYLCESGFLFEINWLCVSVMVTTDSDDRDRRREGGLASALTPNSR